MQPLQVGRHHDDLSADDARLIAAAVLHVMTVDAGATLGGRLDTASMTRSRNRTGSRSPCLASSIIFLATISVAGSVRLTSSGTRAISFPSWSTTQTMNAGSAPSRASSPAMRDASAQASAN